MPCLRSAQQSEFCMPSRFIPIDTPTGHWIGGIFVFLVSLCLFLWCFVSIKNQLDFIKSAARADGVVVRQTSGKRHVLVRFNTAKGELIEYHQNGGISYEAGAKVTVLYHADDPRDGPSTDAFGALWRSSIMLFGTGIFTLLLSWLTIFKPELININ